MSTILRNKYKGPVVGLIFFCTILVLAEIVGAVFIGSPNRLDKIRNLLKQDGQLFWRQRSNLDVDFEGARVITNGFGLRNVQFTVEKPKGRVRIICLGASPTFGWGVDQKQIYSNELERLIKASSAHSKNVEVINAGQVGFTSFQGLQFFENQILKWSPDVITVSYVINDVDKYRFYRNHGKYDKDLAPKNQLLVSVENMLEHSKFFKAYKKLIEKSQSLSLQYFGQRGTAAYVERRRVSAEDYRSNLEKLISSARAKGIKVVLIKMPVNLPSVKTVSESDKRSAERQIDIALGAAGEQDIVKAIKTLEQAVTYDPYSARAYYYLGQFKQRMKLFAEAEKYYKQTVLMELYECEQLAKTYNRIMQELAQQEDVLLVDIVEAFSKYVNKTNEYLFLDPDHDTIHPNSLGHRIIGQSLFEALVRSRLIT